VAAEETLSLKLKLGIEKNKIFSVFGRLKNFARLLF
jgi:hypothetical protein